MPIKAFFNLIRWPNLLLIASCLIIIKFSLFSIEAYPVAITLNWFGYSLLIVSSVFIAAAGNIINDIQDVVADKVNKPKRVIVGRLISEKTAFNWFLLFNVLGILLGFYLANLIGKPIFTMLFIGSSGLLYLYATTLKSYLLIGNILISALVALVFLLPAIFDLMPAITPQNQSLQKFFFSILTDYAVFAFVVNLIREIVKDQEDIAGDHKMKFKTLPLVLGKQRTNIILFALGCLAVVGLVYYVLTYFYENTLVLTYSLIGLVLPLLLFVVKVPSANSKKDFRQLSLLLKITMSLGVLSLLLYGFIHSS